jgi:N-acyl-D-amino-acid deacylase
VDLIIRNGQIVDGSGRPRFRGDVGVRDGKIVAVGNLAEVSAARTIDATGQVVAPGFVDVHSHSDFTLLVDPRAQSSIYQGVTTEVIGNCGHGCAPLAAPGEAARFVGNIYGYRPDVPLDWRTLGEYLDRLAAARPAVNVVPLVPNGNLRLAVLGLADRPADLGEVRQMARLLEASLDDGAFGYSTGLEYATESGCSEEEIVALCRVVARRGGLYATHTRNRDVRALDAIEEAILVAEAAGVRLQISHIIPRRAGVPEVAARAIEVVERAWDRGLDIAFDSHTRLHGITNLSAALPAWALEGGTSEVVARLRDPSARAAMKRYPSLIASFGLGGWDRVSLFTSSAHPDFVGTTFADLTPPGGDTVDLIFDLLAAEVATPEGIHHALCICHSYEEDDLRRTFQHPLCTVGSDATALAIDGPLASSTFLGAFTWAAWFFRRFVRETTTFTIEEAVQKLSAAPAERLGLVGRGRITPGAWADLVVFDPARFAERGTLAAPNQLATGVTHVLVNGTPTLENGTMTGDRGGAVLRQA